jgi:hypothetical protein
MLLVCVAGGLHKPRIRERKKVEYLWRRSLIEQLVVADLVDKFPPFVKPECSQEPISGSSESSPHPAILD